MSEFVVRPIGTVGSDGKGTWLEVKKEYIPALQALEGFSHIQVLWWFSDLDGEQYRSTLQMDQPYKGAPETMGTFATRSPLRPNPIALTTAKILHIDSDNGLIHITFIDANDNTPILDIKPYTPSLDRVEAPQVPAWCRHWPQSMEKSADFAWEEEFNF
ncbi:tRNA-Thr(GGU) m(6)t(6)A37 methyltransferase TsaA [Paenibacillus turicensis]|uniref:tRNA-Thr(GGU) m(6)t(6)A37 methyltransferase TsaA n=1 Tax=Paenibacillus turicensis TaxID=160487 RepID=A0ABS4FMH2_9BACL|nr:SAM-dependent methyltransferase [Paenibacillus turicensis]MBP1903775.1 tRNA-Thr(GGU) m(6)t(6)A37 methyltransferase TsaA [Paenibacillus turicensis]